MPVDLHLHTTASDGALSPEEVVRAARDAGLSTIAITDHDTTEGLPEALRAGKELGIEVIPAVEISTDWQDTEIHILGYYIDYKSPDFQDTLKELRMARVERAKEMVRKLNRLGFDVDYRQVARLADQGAVGRPHVAAALVEKGLVHTVEEAFQRLIGRHGPAYVPRYKLTPYQAVELIKENSGLPVLAHPALSRRDDLVPGLVTAGVVGIEVWHSDHSEADSKRYLDLARKLDLIPTAGSDWHGPGVKEGIQLGDVTGADWIVDELKARQDAANGNPG